MVIGLAVTVSKACLQITLILLNTGPNAQSSDAGDLDTPEKSHRVLPLNGKVTVLNFIRKEKKISC